MSEPGTSAPYLPKDINTQISKDQCAVELEQLSVLSQQVMNHIKTVDIKLRQMEALHQKIMGVLRYEIEFTFSK